MISSLGGFQYKCFLKFEAILDQKKTLLLKNGRGQQFLADALLSYEK